MRLASRFATWALLAAAIGRPAVATPGDPPSPTGDPEPPIPIFLNAPTDLDAFWKRLTRPDFVLLDGELYRKLREPVEAPKPPKAVVESLEVKGTVSGDWARLVVSCRVAMATDGPAWVPIHLDGLTLTDAADASGDLPTRIIEGKSWQVELKGSGEHLVRVGLLAPVRSTVDGRRLELAVPPAASTRVDLVVPGRVLDASTGPNEPVGPVAVAEGVGVRLSARLGPRSRIELDWRERADPAVKLPTLLQAQGEISLEVERGSIRSRSSWVVSSIRGSTGQITLRLDSLEELLDLSVDGKPVPVETRREGSRTVVTIPLAEPLRPESPRTLLLDTRRAIVASGTARVTVQGYSFDQAKVQTGVVAIARTGPIFLNPTQGRGLRRVDPRTKLPETLRARPDTSLAFEFDDQPFDLGLEVQPAPPRLRIEARTTVLVEPRTARVRSRLEGRTSQGKVFEIKVVVPKGLEFEGAEPAEAVESVQVVPLDPDAGPAQGVDSARLATIRLTPQAREADPFAIVLKGKAAIDPSKPVALPIFRPLADSSEGGRFAIVADRNVSVEPDEVDDGPAACRVDWGSPPADWPWSPRRPGPESAILWLRSDANPETIPLHVTVRPRSIRHESTLLATIDRRGAEVVEEIAVDVAFGVASRLDIALPPEVPPRWDVEGVELAAREPLKAEAGGPRRYRLKFAREYTDAFRLRIRYRLPFADPPEGNRIAKLRLDPIRVLEGNSTSRQVLVSADSRFDLKPDAKGWEASAIVEPSTTPEASPPVRLAFSSGEERPGPVDVVVRAGPRLALPGVVVSRLWIKSVQRPDDDLATTARLWVESRDGEIRVGLPNGSRWVGARVGGVDLAEGNVEPLGADEYRLRFPGANPSGSMLVAIDFVVPAASTSIGWPTLRLLGDGIVQQTMWEAQIVESRAGIGTPSGWTDENEWYWAGGPWRRRPSKGPVELWHWLTGGNARSRSGETLDAGESAGRQSYLFSRVGSPTTLRFPIFGRVGLLLLCSGPPLAVGLLVLARRPPPRSIATAVLILGFGAGSLVEPDVLILVAQSSLLGFALWLSALAMNWAIEKAGHPRVGGEGALIVATPSANGSSMARPIGPTASDDSTAIRVRPAHPSAASTADHVYLIRPLGHPIDE